MADVSPYAPRDLDFMRDFGEEAQNYPCKYIAVDLRDGRFSVFIVHRDSREWWRLIAEFSTWDRAERYADVENECMGDIGEGRPDSAAAASRWDQEHVPAPATLPEEPSTRLISPKDIAPPAAPEPIQAPEPPAVPEATPPREAPLVLASMPGIPDRTCERCGESIIGQRARNPKTKYCSDACTRSASKERAKASKPSEPPPELSKASNDAPAPTDVVLADAPPCSDIPPPNQNGSVESSPEPQHTGGFSMFEGKDAAVVREALLRRINRSQVVADADEG